jgi:hypothetical protein
MQVLSNDQLFRTAPSIFATSPWEKVSDQYAFIPTLQVVDALRNEGFQPVRALQSKTRIEGKGNFTKHMLRFRREQDLQGFAVGQEVPEIVLVNSHDRSSSYQLSAGVFRLVCSNGMVVSSANFGTIKIQHSGDIIGRVLEGSYSIIKETPLVLESMEVMKSINLNPLQQKAFAMAALSLRYPIDANGNIAAPIEAEQLLNVRRNEDRNNDLWTTFNRVQENFIRGGLDGRTKTNRPRQTRPINSVSEDIRMNKALWLLAEELGKMIN